MHWIGVNIFYKVIQGVLFLLKLKLGFSRKIRNPPVGDINKKKEKILKFQGVCHLVFQRGRGCIGYDFFLEKSIHLYTNQLMYL